LSDTATLQDQKWLAANTWGVNNPRVCLERSIPQRLLGVKPAASDGVAVSCNNLQGNVFTYKAFVLLNL